MMYLSHKKKRDQTLLSPQYLCIMLYLTENQTWLGLLCTTTSYMVSCPLKNCGIVLNLWTLQPCDTSEPKSGEVILSEQELACHTWQKTIQKVSQWYNSRDDTWFVGAQNKLKISSLSSDLSLTVTVSNASDLSLDKAEAPSSPCVLQSGGAAASDTSARGTISQGSLTPEFERGFLLQHTIQLFSWTGLSFVNLSL